MTAKELYDYADQNDIDIGFFLMHRVEAFSAPLPDGSCVIAIDPTKLSGALDEKMKLGHEIGHCATHSFYTPDTPVHERIKQERRADRWQIERMIPKAAYLLAVQSGCSEPFALAERFGVSETLMRKAMWLYKYGNMDAEPWWVTA